MQFYIIAWSSEGNMVLLAGAPSCYLELLDKLQKRTCRTVGRSLAASLGTLGSLSKCS